MKATTYVALLVLLLTTGCKRYYTTNNFDEKTIDHQTIAVLPFQMEFSGIQPKEYTPEIIEMIEENESLLFQASFFDEILQSTRNGRKPIRVDVQHYSKTLSLLEDNNIGIRDSWFEDPSKLAELLGVDAVVKARIQKTRYMSDAASYGIEVGTQILDVLTEGSILTGISPRNKDVKTSYSLVDKNQGTVLWSIDFDYQADWRSRSEDIVAAINFRSAKRFPYRTKRSR